MARERRVQFIGRPFPFRRKATASAEASCYVKRINDGRDSPEGAGMLGAGTSLSPSSSPTSSSFENKGKGAEHLARTYCLLNTRPGAHFLRASRWRAVTR